MIIGITGGAGLIGSHLTRQLLDAGHTVSVFDCFRSVIQPPSSIHDANLNFRFTFLLNGADICRGITWDQEEVMSWVRKINADAIIHLAAMSLPNVSLKYPQETFNDFLIGTTNLLGAIASMDRKPKARFVFASSSTVYGDFETEPMPETGRTDPKDVYGGLKLSAEYLVKAYAKNFGIPYTIVRPSSVYGPTDNLNRIVDLFLTKAMNEETIYAENPARTLDFTYVTDAAAAIAGLTISEAAANRTFNVSRGRSRTVQELIDIIRVRYPTIKVEVTQEQAHRGKRGALDVSAAKALGYSPKVDLEEGVKLTAQYMESTRMKYDI